MKEKNTISIREYDDSYKNQVIQLVGECLVDQRIIKANSLPIDDDDLQHISQVYIERGGFWIALVNNVVVGTVGIQNREGNLTKLKRMFIKKEMRGTGLGFNLLETALSFAKEKGYTKITLNTHKNMKRAHHFYEKNKFIFIKKTGDVMLTYEREL